MLASRIKDFKLRKNFFKIEYFKKINKFLFVNLLSKKQNLTPKNKLIVQLLALQLNSKVSKIKIKNRCILSNRNKGVNKYYNLSRITMREFMQFGVIPGYTKAVW